jgi:hypothetical protein
MVKIGLISDRNEEEKIENREYSFIHHDFVTL